MANGYDRFDSEGNSGGSFVMGLLTGTVLGAGLGMLFAPKAGSELRNQISEQASNLATQAQGGYRKASEAAGQWAEKGRDAYNQAREAVTKGTEDAQRYIRDTANSARETARETAGSMADSGSSATRSTSNPTGSRLS